MKVSSSDILLVSLAIQYHEKESNDKVLSPGNIINTHI